MNWKQSLVSAVREFIKVVLLAVIPLVIAGLSTRKLDWIAISIAGAIAFLNALNEYLKKWGSVNFNGLMGQ